jgi:enoyl-CoA hydratase/carnithine racemase
MRGWWQDQAMSTIRRERLGDVEVLRLDRPQRRNAMDTALLHELLGALEELAADADLRALVVSTTDVTALSAGADIGEDLDAAGGVARMAAFTELYAALEAFPAPTIAVCVGNAVGAGAELAAGCDVRVAGDNLKLAWAGARHGVPVGPARLSPLVGAARARELILTGRVVGGEEAVRLGLATEVVAAADAEARAIELAQGLGAPAGLRALKALFRDLDGMAARVALENERLTAFQRDGVGLPRR